MSSFHIVAPILSIHVRAKPKRPHVDAACEHTGSAMDVPSADAIVNEWVGLAAHCGSV